MELEGKNVLITGSSSGIGQAIAIRFARDGANVAINYRNGVEQAQATLEMARRARTNGTGKQIVVQADRGGGGALEYAGNGIRVNSVGPGAVVTPVNKAWIDNPKARGGLTLYSEFRTAWSSGE